MKQPPFRLFLIIIVALLAGTPLVWGLGSVLYENPSTMRSFPKKTEAGYLATADGGVVNVMSSPAPTAVGQALRIMNLSPLQAGFVAEPDGGVSGLGTAGYLTEWTGPHTQGNSTLWESGGSMYRQIAGASNYLYLESYGVSRYSSFGLRHSRGSSIENT